MPDSLEAIAERLRAAGAVFSVHAPLLTSLSFCDKSLRPEVLDDIARMTGVDTLYLGGSDATDAVVERLSGLDLVWLELSDTCITNAAIACAAKYPRLQTLMLFGTQIDDACIPLLESMPSLRRVGLDASGVSRSGRARLKKSRPDVEVS